MKRILSSIILILSLLASLPLTAQSDAIKYANDLYAKGNFQAAAKQYEKILQNEGVAPELYYNLGNAYYKMNEIGLAILNYERALKLSPLFEDARFNLQLAQQKIVDNVNYNQQFFIQRWITDLMHMFTSNQWFTAGYLFFLAALVFAFLFAFGTSVRQRKNSFYTGIVLLLFAVTSLIFSGIRKNEETNSLQAIIMTGVVTVKSSPDESGTDLFQLHEGTKVTIKSVLGDWAEIKIGNGNVGWVENKSIEKI